MASNRPTKKQIELLRFIETFMKGNDYSPSYREIMRALGYKSVSTVASHIDQLVVKGYLERDTYSPRSLTVVGSTTGERPLSSQQTAIDQVNKLLKDSEQPEADQAAIKRVVELLEHEASQ